MFAPTKSMLGSDDSILPDASGFFLGPASINLSMHHSPLVDEDDPTELSFSTFVDKTGDSSVQRDPLSLCEPDLFVPHEDHAVKPERQILSEKMPFDDGFIALGTFCLYDSNGITYIKGQGQSADDVYPHLLIKHGLSKRQIRLDGLSIGTKSTLTIPRAAPDIPLSSNSVTSVRVYILPEDVDRSSRGNVKEFHKMVKYLLKYVDCSVEAWRGHADPWGSVQVYQEPVLQVEESLFYTFNTLSSPVSDGGKNLYTGPAHGLQAMQDVLDDNVTGLNAILYPYQKRSVAAMLKREADPAKIKDPRKVRMLDIYGNTFYLDLNQGSLFRQQPLYLEPRGGILAETMGYGKTLICLALILATRGHYPAVPQHCIEARAPATYPTTPSLLSMAARRLKYEGLPWKNEFYLMKKEGYHHDQCIEELKKYERSYEEPTGGTMNPTRRGKPEYGNTVYLCSSTLIIVPPNLIIQWSHEIQQHVDADALSICIIDSPTSTVPSRTELVKHDIVLISKSRFEQEYRDDDLNQGKGIRYAEKYKSPLTEVRWLRVICDEGHGFAGSPTKTNSMAMLDKMFIERRWVVSGTPSSTLHGVEVGLASAESGESDPTDLSLSRRVSIGSTLQSRRAPAIRELEAKDLERLRLIVVNFLKLQPWSNKKGDDQADWKTYLAPRRDETGKYLSMPALQEVMQTLIIRHRIQDLDCDLALPPLHNRVVYLEPSYYDKLSINLFVMVLASNYVTSEREDQDYMFHPQNRGKFTTLINNLGHASFYWVGFTAQDVKDTLRIATEYLNVNIDKVSDADGMLLTQAIEEGTRALTDTGWQAFSGFHEMGVHIRGFPDRAGEVWALDGVGKTPLLLGTTQARKAQEYVTNHRSRPDTTVGLLNYGKKVMGTTRSEAAEREKEIQTRRKGIGQRDVGLADAPSKRAPQGSSSTPNKKTTVRTGVQRRKADAETPDRTIAFEPLSEKRSPVHTGPDHLISPNAPHVPTSTIAGFASSKLAYLCSKILSHADEKAIIFYTHNNTAFFIAEALELLRITFLIYSNTLSVKQRAEHLAEFNTDFRTSVLLMDLKQAGQGLHVAAASRVYIVSPIWDQAIESQAIKRAHRIGQNREVFVETLVLRDTFEETLVKRRKDKRQNHDQNVTGNENENINIFTESTQEDAITPPSGRKQANPILDDSVMVQTLKNIQFLKISSNDEKDKFAHLATPIRLFESERKAEIPAQENATAPSATKTGKRIPPRSNSSEANMTPLPLRPSIFGQQSPTSEPEEPSASKRRGSASNDARSKRARSTQMM